MTIVGLTGGIGSGKTTIAKMFQSMGVPVYYADDEAKKIMNTSSLVKNKLIDVFGEETFIEGELNRPYLADIVFNNKSDLLKINAIVHPEVEKDFRNWLTQQKFNYVIQENAIIFENKNEDRFDIIITVTAPKEVKIDRVILRDHTTREKVLERMTKQLRDDYRISHSKYVIYNTDLEQSKNQVVKIHKQLINRKNS